MDQLPAIAQIEGIARVEEIAEQVDDNDAAAGISQSGDALVYSVWGRGLTGLGEVVGMLDAGPVDMDHCFFRGAPGGTTIDSTHRKVVGIRNATGSSEQKHATFTAGSIAGDDLNDSGNDPKRGGAWAAKLFLGNRNDITGGSMVTSMATELAAAGQANAYIHSNSWHANNGGDYDNTAAGVDQYTWANEDHLVLGSIVNSSPPWAQTTPLKAGPPATAKNAIGVSAAHVDLTFGRGVAGPTGLGLLPMEQRRKPDLLVIGCLVESAEINSRMRDRLLRSATKRPHAAV